MDREEVENTVLVEVGRRAGQDSLTGRRGPPGAAARRIHEAHDVVFHVGEVLGPPSRSPALRFEMDEEQ